MTIFNDVSARDVQFFEMSLGIGPSKGKDFCTAVGPCVLTMDEVDEWDDVVELEASGVGALRNPVGPRQVALPGASLPSYTGAPRIGNRR